MYEKRKRMKCNVNVRDLCALVRFAVLVFALSCYAVIPAKALGQGEMSLVKLKNVKMIDAIRAVEKASSYKFVYNNNEVDVNRVISVDTENKDAETIVKEIFSDYIVVFDGTTVVVTSSAYSPDQQKRQSVKGTVIDVSGEPVIGASILVKGTDSHGTVTDIDGVYSLTNVHSDGTLVFTYIGMQKKKFPLMGIRQ